MDCFFHKQNEFKSMKKKSLKIMNIFYCKYDMFITIYL